MKLLQYLALFSVVCMAQQLLAPLPNRGAKPAKPAAAKAPAAKAPVVQAPVVIKKTATDVAAKYSPEEIAGAASELIKSSGVKSADARNPRVRQLLGDLVEAGLA